MKRITLNTLRRIARDEENMLRGSVPRIAALDPEPLIISANRPSTAVRTLTYRIAEVAHVA